jgi:alkaline phosphatase
MYKLLLFFCLFYSSSVSAQKLYTTANAHSHNDYEKPHPFCEAYKHGFGSIEADIFLLDVSDELFVAHTRSDISTKKQTLDSLYFQPLVKCIRKNKGFVYADTSRKLQLLVDIKTEAVPTLNRLIALLRTYPELINTSTLQIVISGNQPSADSFLTYPSFIYFDGVVGATYTKEALSRISLFSANFRQLSKWDGKGNIPENEKNEIANAIAQVHQINKPVRFWGAPDTDDAWKAFMNLQVDFINTDRIEALSKFLMKLR